MKHHYDVIEEAIEVLKTTYHWVTGTYDIEESYRIFDGSGSGKTVGFVSAHCIYPQPEPFIAIAFSTEEAAVMFRLLMP